MFQYPGTIADGWALSELPKDYDSLDHSEKATIDSGRESRTCQKYYEAETKTKNPRHWAALRLESAHLRASGAQGLFHWECCYAKL